MFQSFTGSSRKPRHVNLSGQNTGPRKNISATQKSNASTPGGQAAIAHAQAQRLQRGHERERLNASRLFQRSWRGHSSRQKTRQAWREEWDQHELSRTSLQSSDLESLLRPASDNGMSAQTYRSAEECYIQMRLLLHFLDIKLEMDRARLTYFGGALQRTLEEVPSIATGNSWTLQLFRLSKLTIEALDYLIKEPRTLDSGHVGPLMSSLLFLSKLIPKYMARNANRYYAMLSRLLSQERELAKRLQGQIEEAVLALLTPITAETMTAYMAFGTEFLTVPETLTRIQAGGLVAPQLNYTMLTAALGRLMEEDEETKRKILHDKDRSLWLLTHLIFLHKHSLGSTGNFHVAQEMDYIKILSILLAAQGSEISQRVDMVDEPMEDNAKRKISQSNGLSFTPLPAFVREQILTLIQKSSIVSMMSQIELTTSSESKAGSESAQVLATFALTLTRVFPHRADEIRMWLYDGSANLKTAAGVSAIQYFWRYSRSTTIFQNVSQDHYKAVPFIRTFLGLESPQSNRSQQGVQQEWRTLLLFLELYSFAIRNMDDEEFLAGGQFGTGSSTQWGAKIRESSLPLEEVRDLVIFLKNLAFALYWNSKDLQEGDNVEPSTGLGAYFGLAPSHTIKALSAKSGDVSQESARSQLRDLVTGLLRSIHQRE